MLQEKKTLSALMADHLRDLIIEGTLLPGEPVSPNLIVTKWCAHLLEDRQKMGKAQKENQGLGPARSAIKTLTDDGLLENVLGKTPIIKVIQEGSNKVDMFGLILGAEIDDLFFAPMISSIFKEFKAKGERIELIIVNNSADEKKALLNVLRNYKGCIIIPHHESIKTLNYENLISKFKTPIVFVDRKPDVKTIHSIMSNNRLGGKNAARYLYRAGATKIYVLNHFISHYTNEERWKGAEEAALELSIPIRQLRPSEDQKENEEAGEEIAKKLVADIEKDIILNGNKRIGIFSINDRLMAGFINYLKIYINDKITSNNDIKRIETISGRKISNSDSYKLLIGAQIAAISFDNSPVVKNLDIVSLEQKPDVMGTRAAQYIISCARDTPNLSLLSSIEVDTKTVENNKTKLSLADWPSPHFDKSDNSRYLSQKIFKFNNFFGIKNDPSGGKIETIAQKSEANTWTTQGIKIRSKDQTFIENGSYVSNYIIQKMFSNIEKDKKEIFRTYEHDFKYINDNNFENSNLSTKIFLGLLSVKEVDIKPYAKIFAISTDKWENGYLKTHKIYLNDQENEAYSVSYGPSDDEKDVEFKNTSDTDYALIVRIRDADSIDNKNSNCPRFIIGGLKDNGTQAAANYLADKWEYMYDTFFSSFKREGEENTKNDEDRSNIRISKNSTWWNSCMAIVIKFNPEKLDDTSEMVIVRGVCERKRGHPGSN